MLVRDQPAREPPRLVVDERVIQQIEGLEGDGRAVAHRGRHARVGSVEQGQVRVRMEALHHQVDAPVLRRIDRLELVVRGERPGLRRRERVRAGPVEPEVSAQGEQAVPEALGVERAAVESPVPGVSGVDRGVRRVVLGGELIGLREHDPPVHRLDRPARGDEVGGQPFEQLGMGWRRASQAEIRRRGHDRLTEVVLPDPVDHHPRRQGPGRAFGEPAGEGEAAATLGREVDGAVGFQDLRHAAWHHGPELVRVAADLELRVGRLPVADGVGLRGRGHRPGLLEAFDLAAQLLELGVAFPRRLRQLDLREGERLEYSLSTSDAFATNSATAAFRARSRTRSAASPPASAAASFALSRASVSACLRLVVLDAIGGDQRREFARPAVFLRPGERVIRSGEETVEGVIVARGDRVVLVVVAPGAAERQAEHRLAGRVQAVLDDLVLVLQLPGAEPLRLGEEPGRDHPPGIILARPVGGQDVAGDLLVEEPVVRDVGVEGVDHVVAIEVRLGDRIVGVVTGRVGVTGEVEPVAAPTLAVPGRGQQLVDQPREGIGPIVPDERLDPLRAREAGRSGRSTPGG